MIIGDSIWQIKKAGFSLRTKNEHMKQVFLIANCISISYMAIGQNVGIGTNTPNAAAMLHVNIGSSPSHGFLVTGTENGTPTVPNLGAGSRLMFYPGKAAFLYTWVCKVPLRWKNFISHIQTINQLFVFMALSSGVPLYKCCVKGKGF
jgi:hypothetical protein